MGPEVQNNLNIFRLQQKTGLGNYRWLSCELDSGYGSFKQETEEAAPLSKTLKKQWSNSGAETTSLAPFQIFRRILIYPSSLNRKLDLRQALSRKRASVFFSFFLHGLRHTGRTMQCWPLRLFDARNVDSHLVKLRPLLKHVLLMPTRPRV